MSADSRRAGRVLVALTPASHESAPLDLSLALAEDAPQALLGVLFEDPEVLAIARSPLAREIVLTGAERTLDPIRLERQLRAQSAAVRRAFEQHAARLKLAHSFEVVRGEPLTELLRAARTADALVVDVVTRSVAPLGGWPSTLLRRLAETPLRRVAFARTGWLEGSGIVVVTEADDASGATGTALAAALGVAQRTGSALRVVLMSGDDRAALRAAESIDATARAAGVRPAGFTLLRNDAPDAAAAASRSARLIVLTPLQAANARLIASLLERGRGSLLIVRET